MEWHCCIIYQEARPTLVNAAFVGGVDHGERLRVLNKERTFIAACGERKRTGEPRSKQRWSTSACTHAASRAKTAAVVALGKQFSIEPFLAAGNLRTSSWTVIITPKLHTRTTAMTSRQWAVDARPPPQRRRTQVSSFLEYTKAATERRVGCPKIAENKGGETLWSFIFHISMRWFEGSPSLPFRGGWSLPAKMVADQGQRSSRSGRSTRQSPEVLCEVCVPSLGAAAFGASCKLNLTSGIGVERSNTG